MTRPRFMTIILSALIATIAHAWDEPMGFKDYKFGMTKAEVNAIAKVHASKYVSSMTEEQIGSIREVRFLFDTADYSLMKSAFVERYGKPTASSFLAFKNGFGAQFKGELLEWSGSRSSIKLFEIITGKFGSAILRTTEMEKQANEKSNSETKKAAKDL